MTRSINDSSFAKVDGRRSLLKFFIASPLANFLPIAFLSQMLDAQSSDDDIFLQEPLSEVLQKPENAITVFDFQRAAKEKLPMAHYWAIATGNDSDRTVVENRRGFDRIKIRPRVLVDVSKISTAVEIFGQKISTPIFLAPCGSQKAYHPEGELAVGKAAKVRRNNMILSCVSTSAIGDVVKAREDKIWLQIYPTSQWDVGLELLKRAENEGCPVAVITVDVQERPLRQSGAYARKADPRDCKTCHDPKNSFKRKPMLNGIQLKGNSIASPNLDWESIRRLRDATKMKVILKGILTVQDAELCIKNGVDGIIVSNHGGRQLDSGLASIESLREIGKVTRGRIPVLMDGGIRRGTDIFKAIALGADAICIGRPYLWGLAAFGQAGVEKVLEILQSELEIVMKLAGTPNLAAISEAHIG